MKGAGAPYALFDENSISAESIPFFISPGMLAEFMLFDLSDEPRQLEPGTFKVCPAVCLNQLVLGEGVELPQPSLCDGLIVDLSKYPGVILAEGPIKTDCCQWSLSSGDNRRFLDIPGTYRFVLNDLTLAGWFRLYMRAWPKSDFNRPSGLFFGG